MSSSRVAVAWAQRNRERGRGKLDALTLCRFHVAQEHDALACGRERRDELLARCAGANFSRRAKIRRRYFTPPGPTP